jgi:hypothetical protein
MRRLLPFVFSLSGVAFLTVFLLTWQRGHAQSVFDVPAGTAKLPPYKVRVLDIVDRPEITYFAHHTAGLGDINGDGYDDFVITSRMDSAFIFLGGYPTPSHDYSYVLRGGGNGVRVADFNRDGRMDIATVATVTGPGTREYPEFRGALRVHLQKEGPIPFFWEEDVLLEGDDWAYLGNQLANSSAHSLYVLDYNGDGWPDLLTAQRDTLPQSSHRFAVLFPGGPDGFSSGNRVHFRKARDPRDPNGSIAYVHDMRVGDINGDGCDDILIRGRLSRAYGSYYYWDLFLGNPEWRHETPDRVLLGDEAGWAPETGMVMMDVDNDGYCDIIDSRLSKPFDYAWYGNVLVFRSGPELPDVILPNDSIPNLNPFEYGDRSVKWGYRVGDMNGDGTPDLILDWSDGIVTGFYHYPGGRDWRSPMGYFGTNPTLNYVGDWLEPVGDVNGDGYEDVLQPGQATTIGGGNFDKQCRYYLWSGAPQLRPKPSAVESTSPSDARFELAPNPLAPDTPLHIDAGGFRPGAVTLVVTDLLGRTRYSTELESTDGTIRRSLGKLGLSPGMYLVSMQQAKLLLTRNCVVY